MGWLIMLAMRGPSPGNALVRTSKPAPDVDRPSTDGAALSDGIGALRRLAGAMTSRVKVGR